MNRKKIAFFDFVTNFGGAQRCTALLCGQLQKTNKVEVIDAYGVCKEYLEAMAGQGVAVHILIPNARHFCIGQAGKPLLRATRFLEQLPGFFRLRKILLSKMHEIEPDLIWTNSPKALIFLASSSFLRQFPIVFYAHGWCKKSQLTLLKRYLIKYSTDGIFCVSNPTKQALLKWPISEAKIYVVQNTIDFEAILSQRDKGLNNTLPTANQSFKILLPAGLLRTKGQDTAIRAAKILKQNGVNFVMWLAGGVNMGGKSGYIDYLKDLITENGLEESVFLLGWRSDVPSLIDSSDVVILPTHTEGLGLVIVESMILKRPVIATPVGGITDLIEDGQTGLLFPVDDEKALAGNIEKLIKDRDLYHKLVQKAHKHIYEDRSTERHIALVQQALENVIRHKRKAK
jgi:glycosyltransferase involved in cell wall biosynthesis